MMLALNDNVAAQIGATRDKRVFCFVTAVGQKQDFRGRRDRQLNHKRLIVGRC